MKHIANLEALWGLSILVAAVLCCASVVCAQSRQIQSGALAPTQQTTLKQLLDCSKINEEQGSSLGPDAMEGCRSFNELNVSGGLQLNTFTGTNGYACFATTAPGETQNLFVVAALSGVQTVAGDADHNGVASLQTFVDGVKVNDGFAPMAWTQYPKKSSLLWSAGTWAGHGETEMMTMNAAGKLAPDMDESEWQSSQVPKLSVSVEDDNLEFRLELNDRYHRIESLRFNRVTGKASFNLSDKSSDNAQAMRCFPIS